MGATQPALKIQTTLDPDITPRIEKPHTSFSQMATYLRCSMQYYFAYVLKIRSRPSLSTSVGSGGHSALEYNGRYKIRTGQDMAPKDLLDVASDFIDVETQELEASDLKPDENPGASKDRALAAIAIYRKKDAPNIQPAGVEVEFNLDLNRPGMDPIRTVNGKIDLITADNGVDDYKFIGKARAQSEVDLSPQLTLYAKVFQTLTKRMPSRLGYRMFIMGDRPTSIPDARPIVRDQSLMTEEALDRRFARLEFQFRQTERGINSGIFIPTDDPKTCSWCGYRDRCQSSLVTDIEAAKIRGEA
jgi:RecB family exonuclease